MEYLLNIAEQDQPSSMALHELGDRCGLSVLTASFGATGYSSPETKMVTAMGSLFKISAVVF